MIVIIDEIAAAEREEDIIRRFLADESFADIGLRHGMSPQAVRLFCQSRGHCRSGCIKRGWSRDNDIRLQALLDAGIPREKIADIFGLSPTRMKYRIEVLSGQRQKKLPTGQSLRYFEATFPKPYTKMSTLKRIDRLPASDFTKWCRDALPGHEIIVWHGARMKARPEYLRGDIKFECRDDKWWCVKLGGMK